MRQSRLTDRHSVGDTGVDLRVSTHICVVCPIYVLQTLHIYSERIEPTKEQIHWIYGRPNKHERIEEN